MGEKVKVFVNSKFGIFAPNQLIGDFRPEPTFPVEEGVHGVITRYTTSRAGWALILQEHTPSFAAMLKARGIKVIYRCSGEWAPHWEEVVNALNKFGNILTAIQLGNEPPPDKVWDYLSYVEGCIENAGPLAKALGVKLISAGFQAETDPPAEVSLFEKMREVFSRLDGLGIHLYDVYTLKSAACMTHFDRWANFIPNLPIYITEFGIARKYMTISHSTPLLKWRSDLDKVYEYLSWMKIMARNPRVIVMIMFIMGGPFFGSFRGNKEDWLNGNSSYHIHLAALAALGVELSYVAVEIQ